MSEAGPLTWDNLWDIHYGADDVEAIDEALAMHGDYGGLLTLYERDERVAILQSGMLHQTIILFTDSHTTRTLLKANGIEVPEKIELIRPPNPYEPELVGWPGVPPVAIWVKRMPGVFPTESKLRVGWERVAGDEDDWGHAVNQARLVDWEAEDEEL